MKKNYVCVNAKVKAMRAKLLALRDFEGFLGDTRKTVSLSAQQNEKSGLEKILHYLHEKSDKSFVENFAKNFNATPHDFSALDKSSRTSLKRVLGTQTDLQNILWIYRLKRFHKVHGDAVFSHLNPESFRLKPEEISQLAHAKDMQNFFQAVASGVYGEIFLSPQSFVRGEQTVSAAVRAAFRREYRHENLSVACGFLHAKSLETKNIRTAEYGLQNGFSTEEILSLLHF
jgi:vacuolar-type H+-ATPase subunit C/Vma6